LSESWTRAKGFCELRNLRAFCDSFTKINKNVKVRVSMRKEYNYSDSAPTFANSYLWPALKKEINALAMDGCARRAFDLGCGNGATAGMLANIGFDVTGIDTSESGIAQARSAYSSCRFEVASAYDGLAPRFGSFPLVVSLEVIEHLYDPRRFASNIYELTADSGTAIISTPYHGYIKNVALALSGKFDRHFTALWDGGHIKFFSIATLRQLLVEAGFEDISFHRVGRLAPLAKSMIAVAKKPKLQV
jgi:2-polyprenyl-3-methyl-5-hydroxy-6-metoxy-1,4-benzoquinol methylase